MARAEALASEWGCRSVSLETYSFQAPDFYEKLGYRRLFETAAPYPGAWRICFEKTVP